MDLTYYVIAICTALAIVLVAAIFKRDPSERAFLLNRQLIEALTYRDPLRRVVDAEHVLQRGHYFLYKDLRNGYYAVDRCTSSGMTVRVMTTSHFDVAAMLYESRPTLPDDDEAHNIVYIGIYPNTGELI